MYHTLYPRLVTLIVCGDNVMPADWVSPISFSPPLLLVSVGKSRFTHNLIKNKKEFVVAVPKPKLILNILKSSISARDLKEKKIDLFKTKKSKFINTSSLLDADNMECKLINELEAGDHTIFIAKILKSELNNDFVLFHSGNKIFFPSKRRLWDKKNLPTPTDAFMLLKSMVNETVFSHSTSVLKSAKMILKKLKPKISRNIDKGLVISGAILHDIGRAVSHSVDHGVLGAQIIRAYGLPETLALIAERHVGAGISKEEAQALGISHHDLIPQTIEEKIVCYADKLVAGNKINKTIDGEIIKLSDKLGPHHPSIKRLRELKREISSYFISTM